MKEGEILKRSLNITFINPNTEEEILQVLATNIAYSLSEVNKTLKFDYIFKDEY